MKMVDLKNVIDKFIKRWESAPNIERFRNAISISEQSTDLRNLKTLRVKLSSWFGKKLYATGYKAIGKNIEAISGAHDWGTTLGVGFSIRAGKDKINIGRYLMHLLLRLEVLERENAHIKEAIINSE